MVINAKKKLALNYNINLNEHSLHLFSICKLRLTKVIFANLRLDK